MKKDELNKQYKREIKFRAWQTKYETMYNPTDGIYIEFGETLVVGFDDGDLRLEGEDVVLMQYTGLKDKNEKEIYEGDIVSYGKNRLFAVVWAEKYGSWYVVPCGEYENDSELGKTEKACEVIGNIYENPELLQVNK
jgi:uncharacterized phage protein (TIGR01671 family)